MLRVFALLAGALASQSSLILSSRLCESALRYRGGGDIDGIQFADALGSQLLLGGGTRKKYGAVKVYAVGMYIDKAAGLQKFKSQSSEALAKDDSFYTALASGSFGKTLVLKFHRGVGADKIVDALDAALRPRLPGNVVKEFKDAMNTAIGGDAIPKGGELTFACLGSKFTITFGSGKPVALTHPGLGAAFFDVYVGSDPVSPAAKEAFAMGFPKVF